MDLNRYWDAVLKQDPREMRGFFHTDACISWHNTNERFTVEEFIRANCEYPGQWDGEIERTAGAAEDGLTVTAVHVFSCDKSLSFHVTSFIQIKDGKISSIDEYWGDDGDAPQRRLDKHIGTPIR